jgi:[ribosomal protein S18]-alanine N-acetyltransferase
VVWDHDRLVAYVSAIVEQGALYIASLAVAPTHRRQGIAQALMATAESHCPPDVHVRTDNTEALALYHKLGFKQARRLPNYYGDGEDALLLKRLRS